ncbi:MAG: hypothetical protein ACOCXA_05380 [Planctomycetota bacterium]
MSIFFIPLLLVSCAGERQETGDDVARAMAHAQENWQHTKADVQHFVASSGYELHDLGLSSERFLVQRKLEWWRFQDELAWHISQEWGLIQDLTRDVAEHFGYQVSNFPQTREDILRFFAQGDEEWVNLVQDVVVYVEYQRYKLMPLSDSLRQEYDRLQWEWVNLRLDLSSFLEWRQREYSRLRAQLHRFMLDERDVIDDFRRDLGAYMGHAKDSSRRLVVDFKQLVGDEFAKAPRLQDDLYAWWQHHMDDIRSDEDIARAIRHARLEGERLQDDLARYGRHQFDSMKRMLTDWRDFLAFYERELGPMKAEVRRYWEHQLQQRQLVVEDIRRFYALAEEEMALLQEDVGRFTAYADREWEGLRGNFRRFFSNWRQAPFGDSTMPMPGEQLARPRQHGKMRQLEGFNTAQ